MARRRPQDLAIGCPDRTGILQVQTYAANVALVGYVGRDRFHHHRIVKSRCRDYRFILAVHTLVRHHRDAGRAQQCQTGARAAVSGRGQLLLNELETRLLLHLHSALPQSLCGKALHSCTEPHADRNRGNEATGAPLVRARCSHYIGWSGAALTWQALAQQLRCVVRTPPKLVQERTRDGADQAGRSSQTTLRDALGASRYSIAVATVRTACRICRSTSALWVDGRRSKRTLWIVPENGKRP